MTVFPGFIVPLQEILTAMENTGKQKKNDKHLIDGPHIFAAVVMGIIGIPIGWCLVSLGIQNFHEPMADC